MNKEDLLKYLCGACFGLAAGIFNNKKPYEKLIHKMQENDELVINELNKMIEEINDEIAMRTTTIEA